MRTINHHARQGEPRSRGDGIAPSRPALKVSVKATLGVGVVGGVLSCRCVVVLCCVVCCAGAWVHTLALAGRLAELAGLGVRGIMYNTIRVCCYALAL